MLKHLKYIKSEYIEIYSEKCNVDWKAAYHNLHAKADFTTENFEYYLLASSLYSSKIEGNSLDADSFLNNRGKKNFPKKKEVEEIEDLVKAYKFASKNILNKTNLLEAHRILSKTILPVKERGKIRNVPIGVRDAKSLKPVYLAVEPEFVKTEFNKYFDDIIELLKRDLSQKEIFYYASMIHICFAKIHPFIDGNGRTARLIEKWFLVSKLGQGGWSVYSEKYYWDHRPEYYQNIALGFNYYALHWNKCIPFLLMLPEALIYSLE